MPKVVQSLPSNVLPWNIENISSGTARPPILFGILELDLSSTGACNLGLPFHFKIMSFSTTASNPLPSPQAKSSGSLFDKTT